MEKRAYLNEEIRLCTELDLDAVMNLQEVVCQALDDPELFVATSREENKEYLRLPNLIVGAFYDGQVGAYCSLVFSGTGSGNIGWALDWPAERVEMCAKVDTVVVDPALRGRGLQRRLVQECVVAAKERLPGVYLLTTVSPQNVFSLKNMQAEGFEILAKKEMYNGRERYILGKSTDLT